MNLRRSTDNFQKDLLVEVLSASDFEMFGSNSDLLLNWKTNLSKQSDTKLAVTSSVVGEYDYMMSDLLQKLPSRQLENVADLAARTLLRKKSLQPHRFVIKLNREDSLEEEIIESLDQDFQSTLDVTEYLDEAVRTFPTSLSKKRNIKQKISYRFKKPEKGVPLFKFHLKRLYKMWRFKWRRLTRFFDLWRSQLLLVEGSFGTSVVSYFIFLKWVLLINIPGFVFTFSFLVIPQILYTHYQAQTYEYKQDVSFTGIELLTGSGAFEYSVMYYGYYTNESVEIIPGYIYAMKYGYLLTCGGYYFLCLIILGYSYLRSYRIYFIESGGPGTNFYFNLIVSGWDYGIRHHITSDFKHLSLYNEFKEYLSGQQQQGVGMDRDKIIRLYIIRLGTWLSVLGLITFSALITLVISTNLSISTAAYKGTGKDSALSPLAMPIVLSMIQLLVPMAFSFIESYEEYQLPKSELYVHMFRAMVLNATILSVLVYFWLAPARSQIEYNLRTFKGGCWETFVGKEIYRMVIVDLIFVLGYSFFAEFIRKRISKKWHQIKRAEFAIGKHTIDLIYSQSLCWLGLFYSPLLPVVMILKLIIIFYVKRHSVMRNCIPSVKPWRASSTHTIFIGYLFIFFILCCLSVGYSIFIIKPSDNCGPYRNYTAIYEVVNLDMIKKWQKNRPFIKEIFRVIDSPGFVAGLLVFCCMILYYTRTISLSHKATVEQLKLNLISEGKDKRFLMNLLNEVKIRGHKQGIAHPGPLLPKAIADYSAPAMTDAHGGKVFIRTVADNILGTSKV